MKALILIFLSLVTLPFVGLGLLEIKNTIIVQKTTIHTEGLVVGNVRQTGAGGTIYNPMVQFHLVNGKTVIFTDKIGSYPPGLRQRKDRCRKIPASKPRRSHFVLIYTDMDGAHYLSFCRTNAMDHLEYHLFQILEKLNR